MASVTDKLKLTKPELGDTITPEIFSENFQIIFVYRRYRKDKEKGINTCHYKNAIKINNKGRQ